MHELTRRSSDERSTADTSIPSSWIHIDQTRNTRWGHHGHDFMIVIDPPLSLGRI